MQKIDRYEIQRLLSLVVRVRKALIEIHLFTKDLNIYTITSENIIKLHIYLQAIREGFDFFKVDTMEKFLRVLKQKISLFDYADNEKLQKRLQNEEKRILELNENVIV